MEKATSATRHRPKCIGLPNGQWWVALVAFFKKRPCRLEILAQFVRIWYLALHPPYGAEQSAGSGNATARQPRLEKRGRWRGREVAELLNQYPEYRIVIIGHTDSEGSADYNQKLSERRAKSVLNYMKTQGVDPKRMTIIGFGEDRPVADNAAPEGKAKNRRVEFQLLK